jgi:uncharacterized membrane protein HdeD (DUF308 family)
MLRLPGVIKTIRLLKLRRIMRKWNSLAIGPLLKVFTILFFWVLAAHWVACTFFIIGWYTCGLFNETWITMYWPDMRDSCFGGQPPDPAVITSTPSPTSASTSA